MVIVPDINNIYQLPIYLPNLRETIYTEDFKTNVKNSSHIISGETFQLIPNVITIINKDISEFRNPVPEAIPKVFTQGIGTMSELSSLVRSSIKSPVGKSRQLF